MGCVEPVCGTLMCPSSARQTVGNEASQTVHWKDHTVCLTFHPARMLCGLSVRSSVSMAFTGNKRPRMASSRLNVDSPRLTIYLEFAPDSRRWWINTVGSAKGARHMHAEAWGHNQCNHHASNAASISRLMDSINKRPLVLYCRVQHVLLQCHQYNIDLIIPHPCSAGLEPEIPLLFIP